MANTETEKKNQQDVDLWKKFNFGNFNEINSGKRKWNLNLFQSLRSGSIGIFQMMLYSGKTPITNDDFKNQWSQFSNNINLQFAEYWKNWNNGQQWYDVFGNVYRSTNLALQGAIQSILLSAAQGASWVISKNVISQAVGKAEQTVSKIFKGSLGFNQNVANTISNVADILSNTGEDSVFMNVLSKGLDIFSSGGLRQYINGVDETSFGQMMEKSWNKGSENFLKLLSGDPIKIKINGTTPFDSGSEMTNIYGKMMLGAPPLFNHITDPKNKSIASTFLRDAKFLTLTPGFPKYNGSSYLMKAKDDSYHQTPSAQSMISYLLKNGLDQNFAEKDRRYYTFKSDFNEYYSYLETMMNTIWIKMGLGTITQKDYSLFSFFDIKNDPNANNTNPSLKPQYRSSIGFFVNPSGALSENISSQPTAFSLASEVNSSSDDYQRINFLTGMGTGGTMRNAAAVMTKSMGLAGQLIDFAKTSASRTIDALTTKGISKLFKLPGAIIGDTRAFLTERDNGAVLQSFATTNGMKVVYPELWADTTFTRSVNINFSFTSPYGDPLSIFNYVMAPFCALLCFAMPRQAADNGYVSPFFVRADIPGLFTSDLALIQDFTWTKGGDNNLWTKDGLPRSISGSMTILDLYPYLAMTKRISFLSANPNYTVFLDNLASLHAVDLNNSNDALNEYYKALLNRVTGDNALTSLWNNYSSNNRMQHQTYANNPSINRLGGNTNNYTSSVWLRGLK